MFKQQDLRLTRQKMVVVGPSNMGIYPSKMGSFKHVSHVEYGYEPSKNAVETAAPVW